MKIKKQYEKHPHKKTLALPGVTHIFRPWINVRLINGERKTLYFKALIDSGSDYTIFPADAGRVIGIDIETGPTVEIFGITGDKIGGYFHDIILDVGGYRGKIRGCFVDVSPLKGLGILGTFGFFDRFKVTLNHNKGKIFLEPYDDSD